MSTSRIPRLSAAPDSRLPEQPSAPRTTGPSSRTLISSTAGSAGSSFGFGSGSSSRYTISTSSTNESRLPATTGRAPALRGSSRLPVSTALSSSTSGASTSGGLRGSVTVLGKRGSGVAELDESQTGINRDMYTKQSRILSLERDKSDLAKKNDELQALLEEKQNEVWKLKSERGTLAERSGRERREGEEAEGKWYEERTAKQKEISSLRLTLHSLESSSAALQSERDQAVGELASLKQTQTRSEAMYEDQVATLEAELETMRGWQRRSASINIEREELKRKLEDIEARRRAEKRESRNGGAVAGAGAGGGGQDEEEGLVGRQEMQRLRDEIKGLSQKLQMQQSSRRTLETELNDLKKAKKEAETEKRALKQSASDARLEVKALREQLAKAEQDMDSLTRPFPSSPSSTSSADIPTLQNRLSTLSDLHKSTTDKLASATLELEQLRVRFNETVAQAHAANQELTKRWQDADRELRWAKEGRAGAEQRERLYRDELDVLRDGAARAMPGGGSFGDDVARVSQLERVVDMYKKQLDEMQRDSQAAEERIIEGHGLVKQAVLDEVQAMLKERQALIADQEHRIAELESANATLDAEVSDAARRLASGEYDPSKTRVLEFANNPAARVKMTRLHELQELNEENEALLQALAELEAAKGLSNEEGAGGDGGDGLQRRYVPRQSFERLVKEKKELEESREKRVLRLKEIFGAKSKEFLEAVYSLLGWKIKFDESGRDIRLTSMYAPKGKMGLTLKFGSSEGHFGTMQMTGAMARGLEDAKQFWVIERQSIPGFLAQVTTECFEKTTIGRASGYVGLE